MKPTLYICLGGAGMKIGHALKYNFATYNPNILLSPDGSSGKVKFLFIENDLYEAERVKLYYGHKQGVLNMDDFIKVGPVNTFRIIERIKKNLKEKKELTEIDEDINQWVDKTIHFPDVIINSACRQFGRIAYAIAYDHIFSKIESAAIQLGNIAFRDADGHLEDNSIEIYIISSICGGTGSSMFLDISALLDVVLGINQSPIKKAVLINTNYSLEQKLSDPNISKTHDQYFNLQMNSVALINECAFFLNNMDKDPNLLGKYTAVNSKHRNRVEAGYPYSPFSSAFIFDIYSNNQMKIPFSRFYYSVADLLFYDCISRRSEKYSSDIEFLTSIKGIIADNGNGINYSTLALKVVKYPHEEILEYFKTRYLYEIFSKVLFNKFLEHDSITKKAEEFVKNVFDDRESSVFASIGSDYKIMLPIFQSKHHLFDNARYFNDNDKLLKKEEILDILNSDSSQVAEIKDELEQKRRTMPDLGFKYSYNNRRTIADQLRRDLLKYVQEIIYSHGYYGVLGINEGSNVEPGFIGEIDRILRDKYRELTKFKNSFNEIEVINTLTTTKNALIGSLSKFRLSLSFNDIKAEINAYHDALNNYLDNLFAYNLCQLQQEIFYYFVVGNRKSDIVGSFFSAELERNSTELDKYRHGLAVAVGCIPNFTNNSAQSISSVFDKGVSDDSSTIRNNFIKFLPNRWNSTRDDVFTVYVPVNLYDYTDPTSPDNWKAGTDLDNKFQTNIVIDHNELSSIFDYDPGNTNLLSELGMDLENVNRNINLMLEKINDSFLSKYYNSMHPIAQYINKTIQDAYFEGSDEVQQKIKDQKNSLVYPVYDPTAIRIPVPYLNIHPRNRFFAEKQLEFDMSHVIEQDSMPMHQMAFVGVVHGFDFHSIQGNDENLQVYKNRDLRVFRPHLEKEWNDYPNGPWDAEKIELNKNIINQ